MSPKPKLISNAQRSNVYFLITHNGVVYTQPEKPSGIYPVIGFVSEGMPEVVKKADLNFELHNSEFPKRIL